MLFRRKKIRTKVQFYLVGGVLLATDDSDNIYEIVKPISNLIAKMLVNGSQFLVDLYFTGKRKGRILKVREIKFIKNI